MKKRILFIYICICILTGCAKSNSGKIQKIQQQADLKAYDSLMIVAHPDDETIWGGDHLLNGNYVVVCITNGDHKMRSKEFERVINKSQSLGIILDYPDKTNGKRDDWKSVKKGIANDIDAMIKQKKWDQIITHNPDGEYGHQHHKMINRMVTARVRKMHRVDQLMYFAPYMKNKDSNMKKNASRYVMHYDRLKEKQKLIALYPSQGRVMKKLKHMFPYENWISYKDWYYN